MPGLAGHESDELPALPLRQRTRRACIWGIAFTLLGYFAGTALTGIEKYASWVGMRVLIVMILFFVIFHFVKKSRETNEDVERDRRTATIQRRTSSSASATPQRATRRLRA